MGSLLEIEYDEHHLADVLAQPLQPGIPQPLPVSECFYAQLVLALPSLPE